MPGKRFGDDRQGAAMNLSQLRYFVKLAELEHYARAAQDLYITQPSLTHAIKTLEAELGAPLFEREGRGVKLTKLGREFSECVRRGLQEIDRGVELVHEYSDGLAGSINIGAIFTVQGDYLPCLIEAYRAAFGVGVKFNLFQGFSLPLVEGLERGTYDVVFAAKPREERPRLCFEHVVSHELVAFVSKEHPLAGAESLSLAELAGYDVCTYREGTPIGDEIDELLGEYDLAVARDYEDEITMGGMVAADPSLCGLATLTIGLKSYSGLSIIPLREVQRDFHRIYMAYKRDELRSRAVESFLEFASDFVPPAHTVPSTE